MIQVLFGQARSGTVKRLPFVLYVTAIHLSLLLFVIAIGVSAGLLEHAASGDIEKTQLALSDWLSLPTVALVVVFSLAITFANFNLVAKRIRDIGLPGWLSVLIYLIARSVLPYLVGYAIGMLLDTVFMLLLCFVTTGKFKRKTDDS